MFKKNSEENKNVCLYGMVDERTKAVVNQGDAYTARFMLFAVLFDISIRGFKFSDPITTSNWDLMLIVIIGGLISTAYQVKSKVLFNHPFSRSFLFITMLMVLCAIIAFIVTFFFVK